MNIISGIQTLLKLSSATWEAVMFVEPSLPFSPYPKVVRLCREEI
jgi:hypothetical protein